MSFTETELLNFMLVDLYKSNLVLVENEQNIIKKPTSAREQQEKDDMILVSEKIAPPPLIRTEGPLVYLGNNNQQITIIVKDEKAIHLQDDLLEILSSILAACKLNLADVAIVNSYTQWVTPAALQSALDPRNVILFGIQTQEIDLPFSIPDYKPQAFNNCTYLQAVSLEKLRTTSADARLEKSKLWVCLKSLFGI